MKSFILISILFCKSLFSYAQVLLEDKTGDIIVRNQFKADDNTALIKLNTGDQSLGFNYIISSKLNNNNAYFIHEFGVKAKPTEGFASVFSNKEFSPGIKFSYATTKVRIFSKSIKNPFIDWAGIELNYDVNKYSLFNSNNTFANQFYSKKFKAFSALLSYNYLFTSGGTWINSKVLFSFRAGYSKRNNFDDLSSITVEDVRSTIDPLTGIERHIAKSKTLKAGTFKDFNVFPLIFAITKLTPTDSATSTNSKKLRIGYTIYFKDLIQNDPPKQDVGIIFFLTKQDASGIRNPVFGLHIQADDPFNIYKSNEGFQSRITIGFTTVFSL